MCAEEVDEENFPSGSAEDEMIRSESRGQRAIHPSIPSMDAKIERIMHSKFGTCGLSCNYSFESNLFNCQGSVAVAHSVYVALSHQNDFPTRKVQPTQPQSTPQRASYDIWMPAALMTFKVPTLPYLTFKTLTTSQPLQLRITLPNHKAPKVRL